MQVESASSAIRPRRGFTLTDLFVLIALTGTIFAIIVPAMARRTGEGSSRLKCASNLRSIAQAAIMYAAQDPKSRGKFPRTTFDPAAVDSPALYTGIDSPSAFAVDGPQTGGPQANDVTAALFHLLKLMDLTSETFICPNSEAERLPPEFNLASKSNFPAAKYLSYSYSNPYATKAAIQGGWRFDNTLSPDYPFAADINPGDRGTGGPTAVSYLSPRAEMRTANSPNHWFEGQQVVYADAHVEWCTTAFAGAPIKGAAYRDNIYANAVNVDPITGKGGVIHGPAQHAQDSVLLPTAQDTPAGSIATLAARTPDQTPGTNERLSYLTIVVVLVALMVLIVVVAVVVSRKKKGTA